MLMVEAVAQELREEIEVAETSLLHAAASRPLYPALLVIKYLLTALAPRSVPAHSPRTQVSICLPPSHLGQYLLTAPAPRYLLTVPASRSLPPDAARYDS